MAGYSGTPLVQKLGIKPGARVVAVDMPASFPATLGALPEGARLDTRLATELDVIVFFCSERRVLEAKLDRCKQALAPHGGLWIAWPKRAAKVPTDVTENLVRELGLAAGLVDNKVCAIDDTWSGLRMVYRLSDRPAASAPAKTARGKSRPARRPPPPRRR